MYTVKISVRNLVEIVLRSGSLGTKSLLSIERAEEGSRAHRAHQSNKLSENEKYKKEYFLRYKHVYEDMVIEIEGRADGIVLGEYIEEIKSTYLDLNLLYEDGNLLHWAQVLFYAFMYLEELKNNDEDSNINEMDVHLTYFNLVDESTRTFIKHKTYDELKEYVSSIIDVYYGFVKLSHLWKTKRNKSIKSLDFPFDDYRPGQKEMAKNIYYTIKNDRKIFVQAPTGTGKTISTLFPSIKALREGLVDRIFYLTPKSTGKLIGEESIQLMRDNGAKIRSVTLTSKEKICFMDEVNCEAENCPFSDGYFNRINEALRDILTNEDSLSRDIIEDYAIKHNICPFEFSLELTLYSDVIIGDYNYAFDPRVYLKRFFDEKVEKYTFLIDESHNLIDRARSMFSSELTGEVFSDIKKYYKNKNKSISNKANEVSKFFKKKMKDLLILGGEITYSEPEEELIDLVEKFINAVESYLNDEERDKDSVDKDEEKVLIDTYFECKNFIKINELYDAGYITYVKCIGETIVYKLLCIDTSENLKKASVRADSIVFFSATLTPIDYYEDLFGAKDEYKMVLPSPFPKENLNVYVDFDVKTNYKNRGGSYSKISEDLDKMLSSKKGNYIAFFPSYKYLESVYNVFIESYETKYIIKRQEQGLAEDKRQDVIQSFDENYDKSMIYFMVLGGVFAEGIDLKGDKLIGCAIVGLGYPTFDYERQLILDHFDKKRGKGFNYAFTYPGLNRVTQAAGRVIRSEMDKGKILLIGDAYRRQDNRILLPHNWFPLKDVSAIETAIETPKKNILENIVGEETYGEEKDISKTSESD